MTMETPISHHITGIGIFGIWICLYHILGEKRNSGWENGFPKSIAFQVTQAPRSPRKSRRHPRLNGASQPLFLAVDTTLKHICLLEKYDWWPWSWISVLEESLVLICSRNIVWCFPHVRVCLFGPDWQKHEVMHRQWPRFNLSSQFVHRGFWNLAAELQLQPHGNEWTCKFKIIYQIGYLWMALARSKSDLRWYSWFLPSETQQYN